jgi:hypothetical protein
MTIARKVRAGVGMAMAGALLMGGSLLVPATPASAEPELKYCLNHNGRVIQVDEDSLQTHLNHGDSIITTVPPSEPCPDQA